MTKQQAIAQALSHVLWIAGSPCSGKSTISHSIARIYVFVDYHVDAWANNHFARRIAAGDADAKAFINMSMQQRWIERSVETLVQETIESWSREFQLVIEDLLALPEENIIVAEGNFFPASVAPYLTHPKQAIWLVPADEFCEQARRKKQETLSIRQKRHGFYNEDGNQEKRLHNLINRDRHLAHYVREQALALQLPLYEVDGARPPEEMTDLVERHFDDFIIDYFSKEK